MRPRTTIDTNIYVSAWNFGGVPLGVFAFSLDANLAVAASEPIIQEVVRVLRDKFEWEPSDLKEAEDTIRDFSILVTPSEVLYVVKADPADNRIIECAVESRSDFIVSGDKDLLRLGSYKEIQIVTVSEFLRRARTSSGKGEMS